MADYLAPGVTRHIWELNGEVNYFGSADALRQAGLIAVDCQLPGEQPGRRGVRWTDAAGRRWVLSKDGQDFKLQRVSTKTEQAAARRAYEGAIEAQRRLTRIEASLHSWGDSRAQFGYMLGRCVDDILAEVHRYAWANSPDRGPWTLKESAHERFDEIRRMFHIALQSLDATHDPDWRAGLERERALLADSGEQDSSTGDVATLLARVARG